jgi:hypothetical protein
MPQLAREHAMEEKSRTFRPWSHVVSLIYAQLTHALGSTTYATPCGCTRVRYRPFAAQPRPARTPSRTPIANATPGWPMVPHPHSNVEGFDFHGENLTTDPSSVAILRRVNEHGVKPRGGHAAIRG